MNGSVVKKPHLSKNGIRTPCNTENFIPFVVPGLSSSSSGPSSTSKTHSRQESHSSSSSSTSSSSPTVSEIQTREREDGINNDTSPVQVSISVYDRSGQPEEIQANKIPTPNKKETRQNGGETRVVILRSRSGCKNSLKIWWMMKNSITGRLSRQFFS